MSSSPSKSKVNYTIWLSACRLHSKLIWPLLWLLYIGLDLNVLDSREQPTVRATVSRNLSAPKKSAAMHPQLSDCAYLMWQCLDKGFILWEMLYSSEANTKYQQLNVAFPDCINKIKVKRLYTYFTAITIFQDYNDDDSVG